MARPLLRKRAFAARKRSRADWQAPAIWGGLVVALFVVLLLWALAWTPSQTGTNAVAVDRVAATGASVGGGEGTGHADDGDGRGRGDNASGRDWRDGDAEGGSASGAPGVTSAAVGGQQAGRMERSAQEQNAAASPVAGMAGDEVGRRAVELEDEVEPRERAIQPVTIRSPLPATQAAVATKTGASGSWDGSRGSAGMFEAVGPGRHFVYVIDRSGSMRGEKFAAAKKELVGTIERLGSESTFYVIFYGSENEELPQVGRVSATPASKAHAITWISMVNAAGGTEPMPAMRRALALEPDVIFLLSDGEFANEAVSEIRRINRGGDSSSGGEGGGDEARQEAVIHTIGFGAAQHIDVLKQIAEQNGGEYRHIANVGY